MSAQKYWIWLSLKSSSKRHLYRLLNDFGNVSTIFSADMKSLTDFGLTKKEAQPFLDKDLSKAETIIEDCLKKDIHILTLEDADYPERLLNIDFPPLVLYVKGRLPDVDSSVAISIVGTRKATVYGCATAEEFAYELAQSGCLVVSGMALGIDACANRGAMKANGNTIAVLGCGVDICYPKENRRLMDDIIAVSAVISEYPPGTPPESKNFPERNRIISGLSLGTLVVEAPSRSGALITANLALEQGRDVFAIPGNIGAKSSEGCNELIRDGAIIVTKPSDILENYEAFLKSQTYEDDDFITYQEESTEDYENIPKVEISYEESDNALSNQAKDILKAVKNGANTPDMIIEKTGISAPIAMSEITMLEIEGKLRRDGGKIVIGN